MYRIVYEIGFFRNITVLNLDKMTMSITKLTTQENIFKIYTNSNQ